MHVDIPRLHDSRTYIVEPGAEAKVTEAPRSTTSGIALNREW